MRLETFFEKFELLADTEDAIPRLRGLILELAVRGRLSAQENEDQSDPAWQDFIASSKVGEADAAPDQTAFAIPSGWRWATLETLGDVKPRNTAGDSQSASFVPMTLVAAEYGRHPEHEVRPWGEIKKGYTHLQDGDVVLAKITPCFENGKSAVMRGLTGGMGAGTTELHVCRMSAVPVLPEFVLIYLKSRGFIERGIPRMTGSAGQKRVPHEYFARSPIPLAPPGEQKRIVAKVDELMALCDRLEAQQQERQTRHAALARASLVRFADAPTPANLSLLFRDECSIDPADLRRAVLALAVKGRLVPQVDEEGTGQEVVASLRASRLGARDNADRVEASVPFDVPETWAVAQMGAIYESSFYGPRFGKEEYVAAGGIPTIRTTDMTPDGRIVLRNPPQVRIDDPKKLALYEVRENDLLVTRSGSIGVMAVFRGGYTAIPSAYLIRFRFPPEVTAEFYYLYLSSPYGQELLGLSLRSIGVPNVNANSISRFAAPVPPLAEQQRIVATTSQLMAQVNELERQIVRSREAAAALVGSVVRELAASA